MDNVEREGRAPFMTLARAETRQKDWNRLRDAIRAHDGAATEAAWEKCERWIGITDANEVAALTAERDALREALESIAALPGSSQNWRVARAALKGQTNG